MFLNRQRPERIKRGTNPSLDRFQNISRIEPPPNLIVNICVNALELRLDQQRRQQRCDGQESIVKGKNSQHAPAVEISKVMNFAARIVEDPGNQKTAEHEKQFDPEPAMVGESPQERVVVAKKVIEEDEEDGDAANAIKGGESGRGWELGRGWGLIVGDF